VNAFHVGYFFKKFEVQSSEYQPGGCLLFSRVSRASYKYIHNYFHILNFVHRTTFRRSQNNRITWQ